MFLMCFSDYFLMSACFCVFLLVDFSMLIMKYHRTFLPPIRKARRVSLPRLKLQSKINYEDRSKDRFHCIFSSADMHSSCLTV